MKKNHIRLCLAVLVALAFCAGLQPFTACAKVYSEDEPAVDDNSKNDAAQPADENTGNNESSDMDEGNSDKDVGQTEIPPTPVKPAAIPAVQAQPVAPPMQPPPQPAAHPTPPPVPQTPAQAAPQPPPPPVQPIETPPVKSGSWWHPHPGTKWQIQYAGHIDTSMNVGAYDLDLVDIDPATIKQLHGRGIKVICYFSAGSYEAWRPDAQSFPASIMGRPNGWKDEKWLDVRRIDILKPIMQARIKMAADKGCDAVDPDNIEGYDNNSGFPLKSSDQLAYNKMIANLAHAAGLAVSLKNDLDQVDELLPYFDFSVNEQCFEYQSCNQLLPFIKAAKPVFNIEYKGSTSQFCPQANKMNFDSLKKDLDLDAKTEACR